MKQIINKLKYLKFYYSFFYKLYAKINIFLFFFINRINKKTYILFTHSSTADTFVIASLIDFFCEKYGKVTLIISESHVETFRIFCQSNDITYVILSEKKCIKFRSFIYEDAKYQKNHLKKGIIKPLHLAFYKNLPDLVNSYRVYYREALTWVMSLDKNIQFKKPIYSKKDFNEITSIFKNVNLDFKKIILINPICYTHTNIPNNLWEQIAEAFSNKGYTVVFNLMKNSNDLNDYQFSNKFPTVNLPAYLIPLVSERIAYTCARWGGGFDLAHLFSDKSQCILINLSKDVSIQKNKLADHPLEHVREIYLNFCNKEIFKIITLNELNFNQNLKMQINNINNV